MNSNKKTVVQMYEEILALAQTDEQRDFLNKRIEMTKKKNTAKSDKPTKAEVEKAQRDAEVENAIISVMTPGVNYTVTEVFQRLDSVSSPQAVTPRLIALSKRGVVQTAKVKGRPVYFIPAED